MSSFMFCSAIAQVSSFSAASSRRLADQIRGPTRCVCNAAAQSSVRRRGSGHRALEGHAPRATREPSSALFLAKTMALLAVKEGAETRQAIVDNLEQLALARLSE